jgi:hypothetical protein
MVFSWLEVENVTVLECHCPCWILSFMRVGLYVSCTSCNSTVTQQGCRHVAKFQEMLDEMNYM